MRGRPGHSPVHTPAMCINCKCSPLLTCLQACDCSCSTDRELWHLLFLIFITLQHCSTESCFIDLLNISLCVCAEVYVCALGTCRSPQRSEELSSPMELELQMLVSCYLSSGN